MIQDLFNKRPKTFMDYEPGKIPSKDEWKTQTTSETKPISNLIDSITKTAERNLVKKGYDAFSESFIDPYGEKREQELQQKEQERKEKLATIRANADKRDRPSQSSASSQTDLFLEGFNWDSKEENAWEKALDSIKTGATDILKKAKETGSKIINNASAWANEKGILDDVTNAFFKASDFSQDFPIKLLPTDIIHKGIANANYKENQKVDLSGYEADGGYINDQGPISSHMRKINYGGSNLNFNGCEVIAVNNALVSLGNRKDIRDIAKEFETDGQVLFGAFGTSPYAIDDFFKKHGYQVETFTGDKKIKTLDLPDADTYIVSFWNSDKATEAIHTVSFDKLPNGKYRMYNQGSKGTQDVDSLRKYFVETNRVPLVLHCIKKG